MMSLNCADVWAHVPQYRIDAKSGWHEMDKLNEQIYFILYRLIKR